MSDLPARERWVVLALFAAISSIYFASASGITSSNDGSHYALIRAINDEGAFEISTYQNYAEWMDIAEIGDRRYSDRPPGTAFVGAVIDRAARLLPPALAPLPTRHDKENPYLVYRVMFPVLAGAGSVVLLYLTARVFLDVPVFGALTGAVFFALGSLQWKYSIMMYSHAFSGFLVMWGVYLALRAARAGRLSWPMAGLLGLLLGWSVLVEYTNLIFAGAVVLFLAYHAWREGVPWVRPAAALVAGVGLPLLLLAWYHTVNFGGPLTTAYRFHHLDEARRFGTTFGFPILEGLRGMLWFGHDFRDNANMGIFLMSPVAFCALPGLPALWRRSRRVFVLAVGLFLVYLLLFSNLQAYSDGTKDGRYITPYLGLLFLPAAVWLGEGFARIARPTLRAASSLGVYGLFFFSVNNVFFHIGYSYNYWVDLDRLVPYFSAHPDNFAYLFGEIFRNTGNLPLLWLIEAVGAGALLAVSYRRQTQIRRKTP